MAKEKLTVHAVILAGGRGTRFWPRSRTRTPKQLLNIVGKDTMLQQTVARLKPLISAERIWTVTNAEQASAVRKQVPAAARKRVLIEPMGLNTAVAIFLAGFHVSRESETFSAKVARGVGKARCIYRNPELRTQATRDLPETRKYLRGLRNPGASNKGRRSTARVCDSCGSGLERYRLMGSGTRAAAGQELFGRQRLRHSGLRPRRPR